MKRKRQDLLIAVALLFAPVCLSVDASGADRPNVILAMADDMGWMDLSAFGNDRVATPHIDRLAKEGIKLTQYYAASAVCTPTRVSVLSGKYPLRFNVTRHFNDRGQFLPTCNTLPKLLKTAGYQTAHVGKWHLGGLRTSDAARRDEIPGPREHGFDHFLTQREEQPIRGKMGRERTLFREGGTCLLRNDEVVGEDDPYYSMYLTDIFGDESVRLIEEFNENEEPFFLNLWWLTPHKPYEPAPEPHWSETAASGISDDQHRFRSMMARMDYNFGKVLDTLDRLKIADNTIVIFVSDNGGAWEANNGNLKAGKTDLHEGGIRVAGLARWPGHIQAGSESGALTHSTDLLPTLCAAAGVVPPEDDTFDGKNILPILTGKENELDRGTVFWQLNLYKSLQRHEPKPKPYATEVARRGKWKMLAMNGEPVELFDLEADIYETKDVLEANPEIVKDLKEELQGWLAEPRIQFGNIPD
ncbi:MAG: sulfatase-like hydrolase/transferase [Verrucomicrobiales bacterium]|nr:sulfatase-like hydrolase/transferase [Verrucomicrobiales bacterium]